MPRSWWTIALLVLLAALSTACGSSGKTSTEPTTTAGVTDGSGGTERGGGSEGGSGGSDSGGGSAGASLSMVHFRSLSVAVSPPNGGSVSDNFQQNGSAVQACTSCSERYRLGTQVILTASAAPGFAFERWQGSDCDGSPSPICSLTIDRDTQITAIFR